MGTVTGSEILAKAMKSQGIEHDYLSDATLAEATCDRLLHNAHRLVLQGPSRRKEAKLDS